MVVNTGFAPTDLSGKIGNAHQPTGAQHQPPSLAELRGDRQRLGSFAASTSSRMSNRSDQVSVDATRSGNSARAGQPRSSKPAACCVPAPRYRKPPTSPASTTLTPRPSQR